jgi:hypothetical protein
MPAQFAHFVSLSFGWVVDQAIGSPVLIEERDELPISVVHHRDLSVATTSERV